MEHHLKTWPEFYNAIVDGSKTFDMRKNDRNFQPGDYLWLEEWDPKTKLHTGRFCLRRTSFVLYGGSGAFGLPEGLCIMSLIDPIEENVIKILKEALIDVRDNNFLQSVNGLPKALQPHQIAQIALEKAEKIQEK